MDMLSLADRIPDETSAYKMLEDLRWAGRPVCPHCGSVSENHYFLTPKNGARKTRTGNYSSRRVWKCRDCRKQFTVLVGTIFHGTRVSLRTWIFVIFEMCSNKNGIAAREIERRYKVKPKTAWFMTQRIREAMKREPLAGLLTGTIIADETYIGGKPKNRHGGMKSLYQRDRYVDTKTPVLSLVNRETGEVRSQVLPKVTGATLRKAISEQVDMANSHLETDELSGYRKVGFKFQSHETVKHAVQEYARGTVTTNQVEGFFGQLKRSVDGTHHHVSGLTPIGGPLAMRVLVRVGDWSSAQRTRLG